jgi:protein-S-isoprenylcysteine O-methyltransferase Ste14
MSEFFQGLAGTLASFPSHGRGGLIVLLLYALESEIRFGRKARRLKAGGADRGSTIALLVASAVPVFGFIVAMRGKSSALSALPGWLRNSESLPGMPVIAWAGVSLGALGLLVRLWALVRLRHRYTRTLLVHEQDHAVERGGPYRFVRHPGYLGSLLSLNGIALASGNVVTVIASVVTTLAAYTYRIHVEDKMLIAAFGTPYEDYRDEVRALLPFI